MGKPFAETMLAVDGDTEASSKLPAFNDSLSVRFTRQRAGAELRTMRHRGVVAALLALAMLAATYLIGQREPAQKPLENTETVARAPSVALDTAPTTDSGRPDPEHGVAEVRAMSPTYRNSTFLVAIRATGFYCDDVVSASESVDGVWVASCADKGGYTLGVLDANRFDVHPIPHFFDGLTPRPLERDTTFEPRPLQR